MPRSLRNAQGFTLIELLITLLIAVLAVGVVAPRFSALIPGVEIKGEAQKVAALMRFARSKAIAEGDVIVLERIEEPMALKLTGKQALYEWPATIEVELRRETGADREGDNVKILFFPDGSSSGGSISLSRNDRRFQIKVDWLTGRVSVYE